MKGPKNGIIKAYIKLPKNHSYHGIENSRCVLLISVG